MRHLDLFSGIGGFSLAASWVFPNHDILGFCEIDEFCHRVLRKHWPDVPIHDDIKQLDGGLFENVDLLTGGFPCQPYSAAGLRRGAKDDRALWPEMFRVIQQSRPRWVVGENVIGFVDMGLEKAVVDLEEIGYEVQPIIVPAVAVSAEHRRDRIWIIAYAGSADRQPHRVPATTAGLGGLPIFREGDGSIALRSTFRAYSTPGQILPRLSITRTGGHGLSGSGVVRMLHGIPGRLDGHRIKALGNAIVPQVAARIFQAIQRIESDPNL